ncbi:MAG: biotin-dependent carboxyltransferase family protein [Nocardioides sp.]
MTLHVREAGVLTTVQDRGRRVFAHLWVPRGGALDAPAAALGNRLVGNDENAAVLEVTMGGLELSTDAGVWVAVTGAPGPVTADGRAGSVDCAEWLPAHAVLRVAGPERGVRRYVAVAGGVDVPLVFGSRSTDTLAWVGPPRVEAGVSLPVGTPYGPPRALDTPRVPVASGLRLLPGPHAGWFTDDALRRLAAEEYVVTGDSDRIGLRLQGPPVPRAEGAPAELPSEGMVLGAVQVPPDGQPIVFLADHPTTGGYPVVAVVDPADLWQCSQTRPGERVMFRRR